MGEWKLGFAGQCISMTRSIQVAPLWAAVQWALGPRPGGSEPVKDQDKAAQELHKKLVS